MDDPFLFICFIVTLFFGIGLHEYAHAKVADSAGDPTPSYYGRVTLNLFKHFDIIGAVMIVITTLSGFGIGWGKPVPCDPRKMRNPRWDHFWTVAAGPLSNVLQALIYAVLFHFLLAFGIRSQEAIMFVVVGVYVNLGLAVFNLIPLGPLDGHWMLGTFMNERSRAKWYLWNQRVGSFVLLFLIIFGQTLGKAHPAFDIIGGIVSPTVFAIARFFGIGM